MTRNPHRHRLLPKPLVSTLFAAIASATLMVAPADDAAAQSANPQVLLKTSVGEIVIELYPEKSPKTVANFLGYVDEGFYSDLIFHRVIGNFMIQGGGFDKTMKQKSARAGIPIESRNGLKNDIGMVAMARTNVPDSASSQFFINTGNNASLNYPSPDGHGYAVFGKVVKGMDTVEKIAAVKTARNGPHGDVPVEPVVIESASRVGK